MKKEEIYKTNRNLFSHAFVGYKFKVPAGLVTFEAGLLGV